VPGRRPTRRSGMRWPAACACPVAAPWGSTKRSQFSRATTSRSALPSRAKAAAYQRPARAAAPPSTGTTRSGRTSPRVMRSPAAARVGSTSATGPLASVPSAAPSAASAVAPRVPRASASVQPASVSASAAASAMSTRALSAARVHSKVGASTSAAGSPAAAPPACGGGPGAIAPRAARCYGPPMPAPVTADYDARWGYRHFDARRYERRRYGGLVRGLNLRLLERVLARALAGVDGRRLVLDVPCGTGIIGDYLSARGFQIVGADISPAMLEVAAERGHALGLLRADLE